MNEKELAAVKQALEALEKSLPRLAPYGEQDWLDSCKAITALQSIISQDALHKMAEDAVTIGLSYNDWPKIGCVNHDCDQCKAVQVPVARYCCHSCFKASGGVMLDRMILCPECGNKRCPKASDHNFSCAGSNEPGQWGSIYTTPPAAPVQEPVGALTNLRVPKERINEIQGGLMAHYSLGTQAPKDLLFAASDCIGALTLDLIDAKRAAPQPVPVKTYHDGKPWPVQPKPWVGLTDEDKEDFWTADQMKNEEWEQLFAKIEIRLKEKNT